MPVLLKRLEQRSGQGRKNIKTRKEAGMLSPWRWSFEEEDPQYAEDDVAREPSVRDTEFDEWMKHIDSLRKR